MKDFMTRLIYTIFAFTFLISGSVNAQMGPQVSDKIVALVNDHIILKSDVDQRIFEFMQSSPGMPFSEELWFDVLETMVDNFVMVEKARIDSVVVSDDEVNRELDQRTRVLVERAGGERQLEQALGKSLVQLRSEYREQFRQEMVADRLRQMKRSTIRITRPEVEEFFNMIPTDSLPTIPEMVEIAHIVSIPPPKKEAENRAFQLAAAIRDSILNHGANFEDMARKYGEDGTAPRGGLLPLMPLGDLVPEYSAAASALTPGEVSQVVQTPFGYHVIRLNQRVADQIETNHILIRVRDDEMDTQFSIDFLTAVRDSIINHGKSFAAMARIHSDDKGTAPSGGRLINTQTGERKLPLEQMDPALYRTIMSLENIGDISEPQAFSTGQQGTQQNVYRIVRLINRVPEHIANLEQDFDLVRNFALQQKQSIEMQKWIQEVRKEVYIEYKIQVPYLTFN
jgi:peptidyl-prolyl cis-trans isomerase SurA